MYDDIYHSQGDRQEVISYISFGQDFQFATTVSRDYDLSSILQKPFLDEFFQKKEKDKKYIGQDLVFSVKLHLDLILYPLTFDPYPLPLPLVPYPLVLFLSRNLGEDSSSSSSRCCCYCYQPKVKSTSSPWLKIWNSIVTRF